MLNVKIMKLKRSLLLSSIIILALFGVLNFDYVSKQAAYRIGSHQHESISQIQGSAVPNRVVIPSLHINAPLVEPRGNSDREFETALAGGIVHYPGTAGPGEQGTCYLFGHSSDYPWAAGKYKAVFALLPSIKTGQQVILFGQDGKPYIYTVTGTKVVAANEIQYVQQKDLSKKQLILQTSYPLGTAAKRFLVFGELQSDTNLPAGRQVTRINTRMMLMLYPIRDISVSFAYWRR